MLKNLNPLKKLLDQKNLFPATEKLFDWREMIKKIQKQPPEVFYKKDVLRNFPKFTGKHLCQSLCFNKVAGRRPTNLLKKEILAQVFPVNFAKLLRTPFLQNTSGGLLLKIKNRRFHMNVGWKSSQVGERTHLFGQFTSHEQPLRSLSLFFSNWYITFRLELHKMYTLHNKASKIMWIK